MTKKKRIDPVTLYTVWYAMQSICYDMRHLVERTGQNYLMTEAHDFSVGIWDASGRTIAMPVGIAVQFLGASFAVKSIVAKFGKNLKPGDVILTNDPYHGGHNCHLPDWGFFRPVFHRGKLMFWTLARGHQQDTGGALPGGYPPNGYDIHAEGLCVPPIKVVEAGRERADVLELIWGNVRFADGVRIDNYAMIAATKLCDVRLNKLLDKFGASTVRQCIEEMMNRTEAAVRNEIGKIPAGTYYGESSTDDDGTILDVPVSVRCNVTVKGGEMVFDFSQNEAQRKGFINCTYATTFAQAVAAAILTFDPALADFHNEGTMRPMTVIAPPGTVVNAVYPATVGASPNSLGVPIMEAVLQALSMAVPEKSIAGAGRTRANRIFGTDAKTGRNYQLTGFNPCGGLGAVYGYDGYQTILMQGRGAMNRGNVEEEEARFPWRYLKYEFATDLMGAGKWRGSPGIHWEAVNEGGEARILTSSNDGDETVGHGCLGGQPPRFSRTLLRRGNEEIRVKVHRVAVIEPGDVLVRLSSGGGGVGDPAERERDRVLEDVRDGIVSPENARDIYRQEIS
ncbi:MAG: hydantoinase B/oxoprolinase family protein [Betaproteobacteria bacterium]|nr:hydantoinase B/oxoprolinase family protein [Betaproteobacteria bacterium]